MPSAPIDSYHRRIEYLRLSVTDRCNLRCTYCVPEKGVPKLEHHDILRYEEILRLAGLAAKMGISKIRITGGEPLVRKDILYLCERISRLNGVKSLSITTNGVLLPEFAQGLLQAGIHRINVSLDTLERGKFERITRRDSFQEVWRGITAAHAAGIAPIKLNAVVMQGVNDDEIEDLARLTFAYPFHVRFIEFMPFQENGRQDPFLSGDEIIDRLKRIGPLVPARSKDSNGPAQHYRFSGALGLIGIISPISHHFCPACNRLRVTADGKLRTCLFSSEETDLRELLRQGALDDEIIAAIREAIEKKPEKHELDSAVFRRCINRPMVAIGG
ncbi:MAG: GTP 3',8-cyclase MoaA [Syntrophobacteraceae bacterium]